MKTSLLPLLAGVTLTAAAARLPATTPFVFHHENVLGTSFTLKVHAAHPADAERAEHAALTEIDRLSKIVSSYDPQSEFSRWTNTRNIAVPVSQDLYELLTQWDTWRDRTGGVLEPGFQAPTPALMRQRHWSLDPAPRTATHLDSVPLRLNSFTKSWILERAARAALAAAPINGVVADGGGDLIIRGSHAETVSIRDPFNDAENTPPIARAVVTNRVVATSGNYRRGSHIIDPTTGQPANNIASATVIAQDEVTAGALATAFAILSPAESRKLAAQTPGVEYLIIAANGRRFTSNSSPFLFAPAPAAAAAAATQTPAIEVTLQFELARIEDGRYRRPYVAAWIEDKDHFPVRTIALWYEKPRWLPDLKAWSRADRLRNMAEGTEIASSVSSATRPPGKYAVKWDGKDQAGKQLKPGKYTLYLEISREHGTYQIVKQELDIAGGPAHYQLPGNPELAGATIDLKKAP